MSENVVPIDDYTETLHKVLGWSDELREMLIANKVAALVVRGVDEAGDVIAFDIFPDTSPTNRLVLIGALYEVANDIASRRPE